MIRILSNSVALLVATALPVLSADFNTAIEALRSGDPGTGAAIFHDLAQAGDGEAMFNLALLYNSGLGVPKNLELALYWAWKARLSAVPRALALIPKLETGLTKDVRARLHDRLLDEVASTAGILDPESFLRLALVEEGLAEKPDRVQVYVWYSLAAAMGHPKAPRLRDQSALLLSPKEAALAEPKALEDFAVWCAASPVMPAACNVLAQAEPVAQGEG